MYGALRPDAVIGERAAVVKLLAGEAQAQMVGANALFVLDFGLDILNSIAGLNLKGDGLTSESLDKDLHSSTKTEHQVKGGFLLDVVVGQGSSILQLLPGKDKTLLVGGNTLLVLV